MAALDNPRWDAPVKAKEMAKLLKCSLNTMWTVRKADIPMEE